MRPRISIRGHVRWSVGLSRKPSDCIIRGSYFQIKAAPKYSFTHFVAQTSTHSFTHLFINNVHSFMKNFRS